MATDHTTVQDKIITANQTTGMAVVQLPPDIAAFDPRIDPFPNNVHVTGNIVTGMPTTRPRRTLVPRRTSCGTPPDSATAGRGISPTAPFPHPPALLSTDRGGAEVPSNQLFGRAHAPVVPAGVCPPRADVPTTVRFVSLVDVEVWESAASIMRR